MILEVMEKELKKTLAPIGQLIGGRYRSYTVILLRLLKSRESTHQLDTR